MTDREKSNCAIWCFVSCLVGMLGGLGLGAGAGVGDTGAIYRDAAHHNAGRWVVEEKTGRTAWEWTGRTP